MLAEPSDTKRAHSPLRADSSRPREARKKEAGHTGYTRKWLAAATAFKKRTWRHVFASRPFANTAPLMTHRDLLFLSVRLSLLCDREERKISKTSDGTAVERRAQGVSRFLRFPLDRRRLDVGENFTSI